MTANSSKAGSRVLRLPGLRQLSPLGVAALVAVTVSVGYVFLVEPGPEPPQVDALPPHVGPSSPGPVSTPFLWRGVSRPATVPAAQANVPDEAEILGVSAGGKHRAYEVSVMKAMIRHVVNDLLGGVPIT